MHYQNFPQTMVLGALQCPYTPRVILGVDVPMQAFRQFSYIRALLSADGGRLRNIPGAVIPDIHLGA